MLTQISASPSSWELLSTEFGREWLLDVNLRDEVDRFLLEERGEEGERDPIAIVRQAILNGHEIGLSKEELEGITALSFLGEPVTDERVEYLEKLVNLQRLDLSGTPVTDEELEHLEKLANLQFLYLSGTQVTDEGLKYLKKLANLRELHLRGTQVDINEAKRRLPRTLVLG